MLNPIRSHVDTVLDSPVTLRKIAISVAGVLIVLAVFALLTTRQIIFFDNNLQFTFSFSCDSRVWGWILDLVGIHQKD